MGAAFNTKIGVYSLDSRPATRDIARGTLMLAMSRKSQSRRRGGSGAAAPDSGRLTLQGVRRDLYRAAQDANPGLPHERSRALRDGLNFLWLIWGSLPPEVRRLASEAGRDARLDPTKRSEDNADELVKQLTELLRKHRKK